VRGVGGGVGDRANTHAHHTHTRRERMCVYMCVCVRVCVCMYVCKYVCMNVHVHVYVCVRCVCEVCV
jgi:t-SNARE complex subunit (syntaxin)